MVKKTIKKPEMKKSYFSKLTGFERFFRKISEEVSEEFQGKNLKSAFLQKNNAQSFQDRFVYCHEKVMINKAVFFYALKEVL